MKINMKVRMKSGAFWAGAIAAALMFIYALAQLLGFELPFTQEAVMNVVMLGLALLATIGIITDPTTPGIQDSERAQGYSVPGGTLEEQDPAMNKQ